MKLVALSDPNDPGRITPNGTIHLLEDLNLDPTGITTLLLAWKFQCKTQCEFTEREFIDGMINMG